MKQILSPVLFLLTALYFVFPTASRASSLILYSDRTVWAANASAVSNIDVEGIAPSGAAVSLGGSITIQSVNFEGYNLGTHAFVPYLYAVDSLYHANPAPYPRYPYDRGTGASFQGPNGDPLYSGTAGDGLMITLPGSGVTALGADFWAFFFEKTLVPAATFAVTFLHGATTLGTWDFQTQSAPNVQFFGATSSTPITQMFIQSLGGLYVPYGTTTTVDAPSTWVEADNFSYGTASVVSSTPEPSTLVLFSGALMGLGLYRRRRR